VKVPPGTQSGAKVRVRGRGIAPPKGDAGDLIVTFEVVVPEQLTADEREAIESMAAKLTTNPREHLGV
jgi:molecular chaperone DnaJ